MEERFLESVRKSFPAAGATLTLGAPLLGGECHPEPLVTVPLSMMNRHGLIAGATGTGKTKTLQLLAEQLSAAGVPVFLADVKSDLSGIGVAGESGERVTQRAHDTGLGEPSDLAPAGRDLGLDQGARLEGSRETPRALARSTR